MSHRTDIDTIELTQVGNQSCACGQAALLLAETTLHILIENQTIKPADAVSAVNTALAVQVELVAADFDGSSGRSSLAMLAAIATSFKAVDPGWRDDDA